MKFLQYKLIRCWKFKTIPPTEICKEVGHSNAIFAGVNFGSPWNIRRGAVPNVIYQYTRYHLEVYNMKMCGGMAQYDTYTAAPHPPMV